MIDPEITFRKLEILLCFLQTETIGRAAEALGISCVSVHRGLHSLESAIHCPLFAHRGHKLQPLPQAFVLAAAAKDILGLLEQGMLQTRQAAGVGGGRIKIGTLYSLTLETIPSLMLGLKSRHPHLEVDLVMDSNRNLLQQLAHQQVHAILIAVDHEMIDPHRLEVVPLFDDDIYLAAHRSSRLDARHDIDLKKLENARFVSLAEGFATYSSFHQAFRLAGFTPNIVTRVNDIFSMANLVQAGIGLTLLPERLTAAYRHSIKLLRLAPAYRMHQSIALVFPKSRELDGNLRALVAECRMYSRHRRDDHAITASCGCVRPIPAKS